MPKGNRTGLFVSSTCYDLTQIRADIFDFAESLGIEPIMSEVDSFPASPYEKNITNCLEAVKNRADIFLLIIGGMYGSINDSGKSITNMEFNEADAKGIPKYIFVKENIISLLPIWKDNPNADYKSCVDTPKLFEFILHLRDSGETWVYPFSTAQDITNTLRKQLSYLFSDCLDLRRRLNKNKIDNIIELKPKALRLVIEKPIGWEYLLFAQLLQDNIELYFQKKLDVELGISFGEPIILKEVSEIIKWTQIKLDWISNIARQITAAINSGSIKALGNFGEPSDIPRMIHLTKRIGDSYNQLLEWKLEFLRVNIDDKFKRLIDLLSELASNSIKEIEVYSNSLYSQIENLIKNSENYRGTTVELTLTLTVPDSNELSKEIERIKKIYAFNLKT